MEFIQERDEAEKSFESRPKNLLGARTAGVGSVGRTVEGSVGRTVDHRTATIQAVGNPSCGDKALGKCGDRWQEEQGLFPLYG